MKYLFVAESGECSNPDVVVAKELQQSEIRSHVARMVASWRSKRAPVTAAYDDSGQGSAAAKSSQWNKNDAIRNMAHRWRVGSSFRHADPLGAAMIMRRSPPSSNLISQINLDPFDSFPSRQLPDGLHDVLEYAYKSLWPAQVPWLKGTALSSAQQEWRKAALWDQLSWHIQVYNICNYAMVLKKLPDKLLISRSFLELRLRHQTAALKCVRRELANLSGAPNPTLLMAVVVLGVNHDVDAAFLPECHPHSPLANAQFNHVLGRLLLMPEHERALGHLVTRAGGLKSLRSFAIADMISVTDMMYATRTGSPLRYERLHPYLSIVRSGRYSLDLQAHLLAQKLGSGFFLHEFIPSRLLVALDTALDATIALDQYNRVSHVPPLLSDIVLEANEAHRRLLEAKEDDIVPSQLERRLTNCCRLASLIYSDMVLYPMPANARVKPRLAEELRRELEDLDWSKLTIGKLDQFNDLHTWILTFGCVAASFTCHREWFAESLSKAIMHRLDTWQVFVSKMEIFLWWPPICEYPARGAWSEALLLSV